jgi:hypothetical protein
MVFLTKIIFEIIDFKNSIFLTKKEKIHTKDVLL